MLSFIILRPEDSTKHRGGEKMFWTGLIMGLFIGANLGLLAFALIASKRRIGACDIYHSEFNEA